MISQTQISALKYLIFNAKNGTELSKRILTFLINNSDDLSQEVCLTLTQDKEGYTAEEIHSAAMGTHAMHSSNCTTHIGALLALAGSELHFSEHYGDFDPTRIGNLFNTDGQFAGFKLWQVSRPGLVREDMPVRYTFWLSRKHYSRTAVLLAATRDDLDRIDLKKSGLYPGAE